MAAHVRHQATEPPGLQRCSSLALRLAGYRDGHGAMMLTANKGIRDWPELFADDEILGAATFDRLLRQPHVLDVKSRSYCSPKPGDDLKM